MNIKKIEVKNFRLLKQVEILLEKGPTVVVGRNNSGKTSLAEIFRRLLSAEGSPTFNLEDFSLGAHEQFWTAFNLRRQGAEDVDVRKALPVIETTLTLGYEDDSADLGALGEFIIDVNPGCTEALAVIRYELEDGKIKGLLDGIELDTAALENEQRNQFFKELKERVHKQYKVRLTAVDPNDSKNEKALEWQKLRSLLHSGFISAQRGLDDITHKDKDVLGRILGVLFNTASSDSADPGDRTTVEKLEDAVQSIQDEIDGDFNEQLKGLLPEFALFGYPGLPDPKLRTETTLDVERLLNNHTKVRYPGVNGVHLPETYNGLGARNLIFILLRLLEFFKKFQASQPSAGVHLIFIEEPEAHLHPQMQEVFISKLTEIADAFAAKYTGGKPWPVQFIVTTHSPHMANRAAFKAMRYFLAIPETAQTEVYMTKVKDLGKASKTYERFLQQYMTLTRCDLLFADKAILIEGTTERLMLPKIIEKLDAGQPVGKKLGSQYISIVEVGGAYAHKFFELLDFLELQTLIITDIDAVNRAAGNKSSKVSEGSHTSNGCIKDWFKDPDISPASLIGKTAQDKTDSNKVRRLAYQVPEAAAKPCGRSFEDAFILANPVLFGLTGESAAKDEDDAYTKAKEEGKSDFALKYAIETTEWSTPRYIKEGLTWLAEGLEQPSAAATVAAAVVEVAK